MKIQKNSELLAPFGVSLVESDQIVTVITVPDPIQLAGRVESDRIRPIVIKTFCFVPHLQKPLR